MVGTRHLEHKESRSGLWPYKDCYPDNLDAFDTQDNIQIIYDAIGSRLEPECLDILYGSYAGRG